MVWRPLTLLILFLLFVFGVVFSVRVSLSFDDFTRQFCRWLNRAAAALLGLFRLSTDYFTAEGNIIEASEVYTDEPQEVEITIDNEGNPQEEGVIQLQVGIIAI